MNSVIKSCYSLKVPRSPRAEPTRCTISILEKKGETPQILSLPEPPSSKVQEPKEIFYFGETYLGIPSRLKKRRGDDDNISLPSFSAPPSNTHRPSPPCPLQWPRRKGQLRPGGSNGKDGDRPRAHRRLTAAWPFLWPLRQTWVLVLPLPPPSCVTKSLGLFRCPLWVGGGGTGSSSIQRACVQCLVPRKGHGEPNAQGQFCFPSGALWARCWNLSCSWLPGDDKSPKWLESQLHGKCIALLLQKLLKTSFDSIRPFCTLPLHSLQTFTSVLASLHLSASTHFPEPYQEARNRISLLRGLCQRPRSGRWRAGSALASPRGRPQK
ncbi:hypothetical protein HJG60_011874 [Phyllostomus discolor]|uniref:Uncharacterized protein n=1 Tax=Phyllostomus discolor TaxID=89673 RepID=A0A833ZJ42_9CHIR|nr:hypothetical protein HJG60_011874 [Phyllostomus discolor]